MTTYPGVDPATRVKTEVGAGGDVLKPDARQPISGCVEREQEYGWKKKKNMRKIYKLNARIFGYLVNVAK